MRFKEKNRWRPENGNSGLMAVRLRNDAGFLGGMGSERVIEVIRVVERMREDEFRTEFAIQGSETIKDGIFDAHGIVADVEELDLGAEHVGGSKRFVSAIRFDLVHRHARLPPELC